MHLDRVISEKSRPWQGVERCFSFTTARALREKCPPLRQHLFVSLTREGKRNYLSAVAVLRKSYPDVCAFFSAVEGQFPIPSSTNHPERASSECYTRTYEVVQFKFFGKSWVIDMCCEKVMVNSSLSFF